MSVQYQIPCGSNACPIHIFSYLIACKYGILGFLTFILTTFCSVWQYLPDFALVSLPEDVAGTSSVTICFLSSRFLMASFLFSLSKSAQSGGGVASLSSTRAESNRPSLMLSNVVTNSSSTYSETKYKGIFSDHIMSICCIWQGHHPEHGIIIPIRVYIIIVCRILNELVSIKGWLTQSKYVLWCSSYFSKHYSTGLLHKNMGFTIILKEFLKANKEFLIKKNHQLWHDSRSFIKFCRILENLQEFLSCCARPVL